MSEDDTRPGTPTPHAWVPTEAGLAMWRPLVASLRVEPVAGGAGGCVLSVSDGERTMTFRLSEAEAAHLASRLRAATATRTELAPLREPGEPAEAFLERAAAWSARTRPVAPGGA